MLKKKAKMFLQNSRRKMIFKKYLF